MSAAEVLDSCAGQSEVIAGNFFIRKIRFARALDRVERHVHAFDHMTFFARGRVLVQLELPDGTSSEVPYAAGSYLLIEAGVYHSMIALDDDALCMCVFVHRTADGVISERYASPLAAQ